MESQATDRALRISQKRNVLVHKFVCRGTIEEKIDAMISDKKRLAADLLDAGGGEARLTELSDAELLRLVRLDLKSATSEVAARVSGSSIYRTTITVKPVPKAKWQQICTDCAGGIDSLVELLQGRHGPPVPSGR